MIGTITAIGASAYRELDDVCTRLVNENGSLFSLYVATICAIWAAVWLSVGVSASGAFESTLEAIFVHQWLGRSLLVCIAFVASAVLVPERERDYDEFRWTIAVLASVALGWCTLFGFYVLQYWAARSP